jgi:hypothetical protein
MKLKFLIIKNLKDRREKDKNKRKTNKISKIKI